MAVPKQRKTKSRRNKRRMHIRIKAPVSVECPKCGELMLPHTVCLNCGYYKGSQVIDVLKKLNKKEKRKRERELKAKGKEEERAKPLSMEDLSKK